jgi:hypothetical protein
MYIDTVQIDINLTTQRLCEIGQIIKDGIKESFDIDLSFNYESTYGYLFIHSTMLADTSFTFYFMSEWTYNYFSLSDRNNLETSDDTMKIYSFNYDTDNSYHPLPDFDLSHAYLHCDLISSAYGFLCKIVDSGSSNKCANLKV